MKSESTQKFYVKNLDCPACAAKIETGPKAIGAVSMASVDFSNLKLHVKTNDIQPVLLEFAAAAELHSNHPIATSITSAIKENAREPKGNLIQIIPNYPEWV